MTFEGLNNYLGARMPLQLNAIQHFRLLGTVFALVFTSSVIIHLLVHVEITLTGMLTHATVVGIIYTIGVTVATTLLHLLGNGLSDVRVWHVWLVTLASFIVGYYFLPIDEFLVWVLGIETEEHIGPAGIWSLVPAWFLVTYFFIQPYLNDSLQAELARLREINAMLEGRQQTTTAADQSIINFESGRTEFGLKADTIRNIVVEDHYCYVHFQQNGGYAKRDLAMPLREVWKLMPSGFAQVHRSHIVNLKHTVRIRRKGRNIRLVLDSGYEVPVSRHRLDDVLPQLQKQMASNGVRVKGQSKKE